MSVTDTQLERLIAMDIDELEREANFAEGFDLPDAAARTWEAAVQEELQERVENYLREEDA